MTPDRLRAERVLIFAMIYEPEVFLWGRVGEKDFEHPGHRLLYQTLLRLREGDGDFPGPEVIWDQLHEAYRAMGKEKDFCAIAGAYAKGDTYEKEGMNVEKALEIIRGELSSPQEAKAKQEFSLISARELLSQPTDEVRWLWDGILPQGGMSLLIAKPKVGKSTLARCLAVAVSRGSLFLGRKTVQASVVYLALEERRSELKRQLERMGVKEEPISFHFGLAPDRAMDKIDDLVRRTGAGLLVVDTLQKLARIKEVERYGQVSLVLERPLAIARERNCHILLSHHAKKLGGGDPGDEVLGSTAFLGGVDTEISLKRREQARTLSTVQRYGEDVPETLILLGEDGELTLGEDLKEAKRAGNWERVEAFIGEHPGTMIEEIREALDLRKAETISALHLGKEKGTLLQKGEGVKGSPFKYTLKKFGFSVPAYIVGTEIPKLENAADPCQSLPNSVQTSSRDLEEAGTESATGLLPNEQAKAESSGQVVQVLGLAE